MAGEPIFGVRILRIENLVVVEHREIEGAERDRIYADQAKEFPGFADYEAKTDRVIPVIALDRT